MKIINGLQWKDALASAANALANNRARIDALNVFPVPDGDTGSNMTATITSAVADISELNSEIIGEVAKKFSRGMLLGARGNSGVILSQIFKGIAINFEGKKTVNGFDMVHAFESAKEFAYKSVMKPIEGTILTVIRLISENIKKTVTPSDSIIDVFKKIVKFAREACDLTPTLLPVLKEVGVTDSGGEGLFIILEGILFSFEGNPVKKSNKENNVTTSLIENEIFDGEFGYCTEFIVELKSPKSFAQLKFQKALEKLGNSIVVVNDEDILKVHIHTLKPGEVFTFAQKLGEFIKLKSENMTLQANASISQRSKPQELKVVPKSNEKKNIAVISCNIGQGIINDMEALGVDFILEAGQTMNPSAKEFIDAIDSLNSEQIIILPNNSNIILVAQQVAQTSKKNIVIVPTKTQMQGIAAMMNFDRDGDLNENQESMIEVISSVKTGEVTIASRTTKIEGVSVVGGEYLAVAERKILGSLSSKTKAAIAICKKLLNDESEFVTIYYGEDATETDASEVASFIESNYDVEIEIKPGYQPIYHFLMAFE